MRQELTKHMVMIDSEIKILYEDFLFLVSIVDMLGKIVFLG